LQVESGTISFQANTKKTGETRRLLFQADASNLKGRRGDQVLVWQFPLKLGGTMRQQGSELALEDFDCQTDFLRMAGNATLESGAFAIKGDLSKLTARLGQFVNLNGVDLAGTIDGNLGWQAAEGVSLAANTAMPIQLGGQFRMDRPVIRFPDLPVWQPVQLLIQFSAAGLAQLDPQTSQTRFEVQTGGAKINIGDENATVVLAGPVKSWIDPISFQCEVNGSISGWLAHLRNFVDLGDLRSDGTIAVKGLTTLKDGHLQFTDLQYLAEQFVFHGYGMKINDPKVNGTIDAGYDLARSEIQLRDVTLISSGLAARGQDFRLTWREAFYADGGIGFRGDIHRLAEWFQASPRAESIHWFGSTEGLLQFTSQEHGVAGHISATLLELTAAQQQLVEDPQYASANRREWVELYRDPKVQVDTQLVIANDFSRILMQNGTIKSSSLSVEASGTIADVTGKLLADIRGRWTPAWGKMQKLMLAYSGNVFHLSGSGTKPFSFRGPLLNDPDEETDPSVPKPWIQNDLEGSIAFAWDEGSFLEVPIGASELNVDVKNSVGYIEARGIPFSGGTIHLAPSIDMRGEQPLIVMKPTRVIDNVALSRDTARKWLKYVAPLAADATSAEGNLTLDVNAVNMPLMHPLSVEANGTILLEDVIIGAGPLTDQLLGTAQQIRSLLKPDASDRDLKTWLHLSRQTIPFVVKDQTIYHENVTLAVKDITIVTSGAVGFDQSLRMMAEIPIADEWIEGKPYLSGLRGQKLRIPIGGTVTKPVLDHRAIQGLSSELARGAARGLINQAVSDHLTPKANELQNKLQERVSGELDRLQDRVGEKVGGVFGPLGNFGAALPNVTAPQNGGESLTEPTRSSGLLEGNNASGTGASPSANTSLTPKEMGKQLEDDLKKGFHDLLKPKR
jgi:translocation and assembly module TamB